MDVSVIGSGLMGGQMARLLLDTGHRVVVYNRTREKAEPLAAAGARVAVSPREAVEASAAVILMLKDAGAIRSTLATGTPSRPTPAAL
jgi:3-hydroxyisobutyrate dehydrogenase